MKHRATGWVNVTSIETKPYDEAGPLAIAEVNLVEDFTGDFVGTGRARFLMVSRADGSAEFAGMERFVGRVGEFAGSFILRNSGVLEDGFVTSEWTVVRGSGTGELSGLRGEGGCRRPDGPFLEYWFE